VSAMSTSGRGSSPNIRMIGKASAGANKRHRLSRKANQASATSPASSVQPESNGLPVSPVLQPATSSATSTSRSIPQPIAQRKGASSPSGMASTDSTPKGMMTSPTKGKASTLPITPSG